MRKLDNKSARQMTTKRWGVAFSGRLKGENLAFKIHKRNYALTGPNALQEMISIIEKSCPQ